MESANLLEASLYCCCKCKGLFNIQDDKLKHQISCMGNPMETTCAYFACERKIFLQLFQPDDFLLDGCDAPFWFSKDDSFINHFVKIRVPDIFDPTIFLKNTTQPNQGDTDDANFLLASNINTLEEETAKTNGNSFLDSNKQVDPIDKQKIQSIINKNIEYLKNDDISGLGTESSKDISQFHQSQSLPRLLSPIDKHLHLFGEGTKSRLQSPFEKSAGFLQDGQVGFGSSFMYSSNPSIPFSCSLSTDLLSGIPPPQDENQQGFPTSIEEFPTLKYLDLAKKDPFFGQNPGLSQINTKDPFLINAAFKTTERPSFTLQKSHLTRSCEDLQASPMPPLQDANYFNFPSTLDEPTQLDYLDLATLDFLTNPNLISYGPGVLKERSCERDNEIYSEGNLTDQEPRSVRSETAVRLSTVPVCDNTETDNVSAFSKVKKKKLRLKKSKSDIGTCKRQENDTSESTSFFAGIPDLREDFQEPVIQSSDHFINVHPKGSRSLIDATDFRISRKRKLVPPKEKNTEAKLMKINRKTSESRRISKSDKIFNVRDKLTHLTEEEKESMKAVIGQSGCIFVKKKRSLSCDEPVVYVNDSQVFMDAEMICRYSKFEDKPSKPELSISKTESLFDEQRKTGKLTSVLKLKCIDCNFQCRSVVELKNHRMNHTKGGENTDSGITQTKCLPVTESFIQMQANSVMMQSNEGCSSMKLINTENQCTSQLQNVLNITLTDEGGVLLQTNGLFSPSLPAAENTENAAVNVSPRASDRSKSVFDNGVIICEATTDTVASQPKVVSLLPKNMTGIPVSLNDHALKIGNCEPFQNTVEASNDMSTETAMAVKAIQDINNESEGSMNEKGLISVQGACATDTRNINDKECITLSRQEMKSEDFELDRFDIVNIAGDLNSNSRIGFDYEFTAVPLETYSSASLANAGQTSFETLTRQDFDTKSDNVEEVIEDTDKVLSQNNSKLDLEEDMPFFAECQSEECLDWETAEKGEKRKTKQIESNCAEELNDSIDIENEFLDADKSRTDMPMPGEDKKHVQNEKEKIPEIKKTSEVKEFDHTQVIEKQDYSTKNYEHRIHKSDRKVHVLQSCSDEPSCQPKKVETDCSGNSGSQHYDPRTHKRIHDVIEDSSVFPGLVDHNYWDSFVESIESENLTELTGGTCVKISSDEIENIHTLNDMEIKSDSRNKTSVENLFNKVETNIIHEQTSLCHDHVLIEIFDQRSENKPVEYLNTEQSENLNELDSQDIKSREHISFTLSGNVEEQNVPVCRGILTTGNENPIFTDPNVVEHTEIQNDSDENEEYSNFDPVPKIEADPYNDYTVMPNVMGNERLDTPDRENCDEMGIGFTTENNENHDISCDMNDPVTPRDNAIKQNLEKSCPETQIENLILGNLDLENKDSDSKVENLSEKQTATHFISVDNLGMANSVNSCKIDISLVTRKRQQRVAKMKSLLNRNIVNVPNIPNQHVNATKDQNREDISKFQIQPSTKDIIHQDSKLFSVVRKCNSPELKINIPELEGNIPEIKGNSPELKGDCPELKSNSPELKGSSPELKGNSPELKGSSPELKGDSPVMKGNSPELKGNIPELKSNSPELKGNSPELKSNSPELKCQTSEENVKTVSPVTKTWKKASDGTYNCDVKGCQFKTLYRSNVSAHYNQVHLALKRYMCDQCTYATPNLTCLKHHLQLNHYKEKRFKCPDCDYLSLFHSDIVKHVRHTHLQQKQFACKQCEYRTGHAHSLRLHIMSHIGIRPFKCNTCDYCAINSNKVMRHISLCHKDEVGASCEKQDVNFEIDPKQFLCEEVKSYQDIKVIELTTDEANAIMKEQADRKEREKQKKESEKKAKEERKVTRAKKKALKDNKMSLKTKSDASQGVIKLTPELAQALMEVKCEKNLTKSEQTVVYTKVLSKPKSLLACDTKVTKLIAEETNNLTTTTTNVINEKNIIENEMINNADLESNIILEPLVIKVKNTCISENNKQK